ncbi:MAG: SDR family NAD(P)-dependent oxidoreductase [Hyphomicrobium sp.]
MIATTSSNDMPTEASDSQPGTAPAVVVTGGSRGIGLAIAHLFARHGHRIVLVARTPAALETAAALIRADALVTVSIVPLDVTRPDAPALLEAELAADGLHVDVLVNCAGVGLAGAFADHTPDDLERMMALNVAGLTRMMRHVLPAMRARRQGGVINVASLGGLVPGPYQAAYYASKAYVISLSEAVASELSGSGVRVSAVAPGPVATGFHAAMGAESALYRRLILELTPDAVARSAYWSYRLGRRLVVPGILNATTALVVRVLPRRLSAALVGWLLKPRASTTPPRATDR